MAKNTTIPGWRKALVPILIVTSSLLLVILIIQFIVNGVRRLYYNILDEEGKVIVTEYAVETAYNEQYDHSEILHQMEAFHPITADDQITVFG